MRLRARRRNLVVWRPSVGPASRYGAPGLTGLARSRRIRRGIRLGGLLAVIGLLRLARAVRPRWRPLLAGAVLTVAGWILRGNVWGIAFVAGLWFLVYALLIPAIPEGKREQHAALARQLASYSTPGQRCDLEATLDRYPDSVTHELREILAGQAVTAGHSGIPGAGRC